MANKKLATVYIVDDDVAAAELLRRRLVDNYSVEIVGVSAHAEEALCDVIEKEPDILFLDVEMPTMSGLEFCSAVRKSVKPDMKVVFYTGHEKYMIDAIRREAFDYLMKPALASDVATIMTRYYENRLISLPAVVGRHCDNNMLILVVNARNEHLALRMEEIVFFRHNNDRKQWEVVCSDRACYTLRHRTTSDVILNYSPLFVQTHKGYIVNVNFVKVIQEACVVLKEPMSDVTEVRLSRGYRHRLMEAFYNM